MLAIYGIYGIYDIYKNIVNENKILKESIKEKDEKINIISNNYENMVNENKILNESIKDNFEIINIIQTNMICPISHQLFKHPVLASDGHFYERAGIKRWININQVSPLTREAISEDVVNCKSLEIIINELLKFENKFEDQYVPSLRHEDNIDKINEIMNSNKYDELLKYTHYNLGLLNFIRNFMKNLNDDAVLKYIIDNNENLEIANKHGWRLVHYVSRYSSLEIIKYIISKNVDLEASTNSGQTPIHLICKFSSPEIIKYVIDMNINLEVTLLYYCIKMYKIHKNTTNLSLS